MDSVSSLRFSRYYSYFLYAYLFGLAGWWRQFARLPGDLIGMPLYITEIVLICGFLLVLHRAFSSPDWRRFLFPPGFARSAFFPLILALALIIPIRVVPDSVEFGYQALRDGVLILYLLFIPLIFWLREQISLKFALISLFLGQSAGVLSYYSFSYLGGLQSNFLHPVANDSIAVLAIAAVFILFKRWNSFSAAMLCLAPTMLSMLFWTKRNLILGGMIVFVALLGYRIELVRNSWRFTLALVTSFIFAIGLLYLPGVAKPLGKDIATMIQKLHAADSLDRPGPEKPQSGLSEAASAQPEHGDCPAGNASDLISPEYMGPRLIHGEDSSPRGLMSWRLYLWKNTWSDISEKPFGGWGFGPIVVKTLPDGRVLNQETFISGPHNAYLTVIFRLGWPLFLVFMAVPISFFIRSYKVRRQLNDIHLIAVSVVLYSYFAAFFNIGFEAPQASVPAYVLMGLLAAPLWSLGQTHTRLKTMPAAH